MSAGYDSLADGETSLGLSAWCASSRCLFARALYKRVKKGPFVLFNPFETGQQCTCYTECLQSCLSRPQFAAAHHPHVFADSLS